MKLCRVLIALAALCLLATAAPALAQQECETSGTLQVTGPAGTNAQLWMKTSSGVFNVINVKNSTLWVASDDGTAVSILVVINETAGSIEPTITIRKFNGDLIIGGTVPIAAGASFIMGITGCGEPAS